MKTCPHCGKTIAEFEAIQGLCPECLLKAGFVTGASIDGAQRSPYVPPTPEELGRYFPQLEILEPLGHGGMGAVYKARQKQLDRLVAVKILPPHISSDPSFAERFAREAKALAKLNHPNIVTLYEFGQADGLFYFLMEYVDGVNLRQLLDAGRLSPREALAIVPQICDALQYAHDQGIVHRDIKPENILMDRRGRVKVADFGLAKLAAAGPADLAGETPHFQAGGVTDAGKVMGTPQYMAPEQIEHPSEVDHRADIYSLGVVFYQMLTGELPKGDFAPPSKKVVIDVRLDEVVLRAMEKRPELRYQQVGDVKTIVETIAGTPSEAIPTGPPRQPPAAPPSAPLTGAVPAAFSERAPEPKPDWTSWFPFQSPLVREILAHRTETERRESAKRELLFGLWNAGTFFGPWFCYMFLPNPLNWIFGICFLVVGLSFFPVWRKMEREFLCTTAWARQHGFTPDQLTGVTVRSDDLKRIKRK